MIETRKERMNKGKEVDDGNNLVGGVGGLNSYGNVTELIVKNVIKICWKEMK